MMQFSRVVTTLLALSSSAVAAHLPVELQSRVPLGDDNSTTTPFFYRGHDLSSLQLLVDGGFIYKDTSDSNVTKPAEDILGAGGMNTVRLRLWVNPVGGIYGLNYTVNLAQHFYQKGYNIYLDYHFSDSWADPGKQILPAAWPQDLADLSSTLQTYVSDTLYAFHTAGVDLAMVSLGNEIRAGMLWPTGYVNVTIQPAAARAQNFTNLATLYKAARNGIDDAVDRGATKPEYVLIHIDNGWDLALQQAWFAALTGSGIVRADDWDLFGVSFYPFYGTQATLHNLSNTLNTLAEQYGKPLHVVETDWPAICSGPQAPPLSDTNVPISALGQTTWVQDIISVLDAVPNGLGQGLHYWEPAWLNNTGLGSACQDNVLFVGEYINATQTIGYSRTSVDMFH